MPPSTKRVTMRSSPALAGRQRLIAQIVSCWRTQALHTAVQLDLPDRLAPEPCDAATLARECDCSAEGLLRLLRALCALGVLRDRTDGRFQLTATGRFLCREPTDDLPSLRSLAFWWGGSMWREWSDLTYSVKTGRSARAKRSRKSHDDFVKRPADTAGMFHGAMQAQTALVCDAVARLELWRDARDLVDVGGGTGELASAIVAAHPKLRGTVLDRADAEPQATAVFKRYNVASRVRFIAGDFFETIPRGGDRYLLKSILHNWNDRDCRRILVRCAEASRKGARLILVERLRPDRLGTSGRDQALARADLNMLIGLEGRERSLEEFHSMLKPSGFAVIGTSATEHEFTVIEAERL